VKLALRIGLLIVLSFSAIQTGLLYAGTDEWIGVVVSANRVFSDPVDSNTIYASHSTSATELTNRTAGILKSTNAGVTWHSVTVAPWPASVLSLAFDSQNAGTMYAGTWGRSVFKSTDAGESWAATSLTDAFVESMAIDTQKPTTVYAAVSFINASPGWGIYKSLDGGVNWTHVGRAGWAIQTLVIDPKDSSILYAGDGGCCSNPGLYKTTDGGTSWWLVPEMESCYMVTVVITKQDPAVQVLEAIGEGNPACAAVDASEDTVRGKRRIKDVWMLRIDGGLSATHPVSLEADAGTWIITGARAHQDIDDHEADYIPVSATLAVSRLVVSGVRVDSPVVRVGGSFTATFTGANLTDETYFDVRFRSPGSATDQLALNWQKGTSAKHDLLTATPAGTWTITGVWAHQDPNDHSSDFAPASATIAVIQ
jgi:hypothetical protein